MADRDSKTTLNGLVDDVMQRSKAESARLRDASEPYIQRARDVAQARPLTFTFCVIFAALSLIPTCIFLGFVISATLFILSIALGGIVLCTLGVFVIGACLLLPVLAFTFLISIFAVGWLLALFLLQRLYFHVREAVTQDGSVQADYQSVTTGVKSWMDETMERLPNGSFEVHINGGHGKPVPNGDSHPKEHIAIKTE